MKLKDKIETVAAITWLAIAVFVLVRIMLVSDRIESKLDRLIDVPVAEESISFSRQADVIAYENTMEAAIKQQFRDAVAANPGLSIVEENEPDTPSWWPKILVVPPYFVYLHYDGDVRWGWSYPIDEPDTPNIYLGEAKDGDTVSVIDCIDQCDDPTYDVLLDTASLIDWTIGYMPVTNIWIHDDYDTDITIHFKNKWDVYQDSAGVHIKVFRKETDGN